MHMTTDQMRDRRDALIETGAESTDPHFNSDLLTRAELWHIAAELAERMDRTNGLLERLAEFGGDERGKEPKE